MSNDELAMIRIEVVYALPTEQCVFTSVFNQAVTVQEAIDASGVLERYPEIDLAFNKVGVYGRLVKLDSALKDKDRVEIYRPLIADPKEIRRIRAEKAKLEQSKSGNFAQ